MMAKHNTRPFQSATPLAYATMSGQEKAKNYGELVPVSRGAEKAPVRGKWITNQIGCMIHPEASRGGRRVKGSGAETDAYSKIAEHLIHILHLKSSNGTVRRNQQHRD